MEKNILKKCIFITLIVFVIIICYMVVVKYDVEGEKNLPFEISKMLEVSTVTGDVEDGDSIWNIKVHQINDIYIYFDKNDDPYFENIAIKDIEFNNFCILQEPKKGNLVLRKPTGELDNLYPINVDENLLESGIKFIGSLNQDLKNLEMTNNGGMVSFRLALEDLGNFVSNEQDEVVYDGTLLTKIGITMEELKYSLSFDINITTTEDITYVGKMIIDLPLDGLIEEGSVSKEINDFSKIVFKRETK